MLEFCCAEFDKPRAGINFQLKASFTSYFFSRPVYAEALKQTSIPSSVPVESGFRSLKGSLFLFKAVPSKLIP